MSEANNQVRHFLDLTDIPKPTLKEMITHSRAMKAAQKRGQGPRPLEGKTLAMIFDKPSTRTRVSFDVGMRQLGGEAIMLTSQEMQLGRGETMTAEDEAVALAKGDDFDRRLLALRSEQIGQGLHPGRVQPAAACGNVDQRDFNARNCAGLWQDRRHARPPLPKGASRFALVRRRALWIGETARRFRAAVRRGPEPFDTSTTTWEAPMEKVTYEQFVIVAARAAVLEDIVKMLLAREIAQRTDIGRFWLDRASVARADLADRTSDRIMPSPVQTTLRELVAIVQAAAELAPSART